MGFVIKMGSPFNVIIQLLQLSSIQSTSSHPPLERGQILKADPYLGLREPSITFLAESQFSESFLQGINDVLEKNTKKKFTAIVPAIVRAVTPAIEKNMSSAITECFQSGGGDKEVNQLEKSVNSNLEATIAVNVSTENKGTIQVFLISVLEMELVHCLVDHGTCS
ncbi:hypothetical protein YC2023_042504 [Brassica napus]